jgi:hypothetical protein
VADNDRLAAALAYQGATAAPPTMAQQLAKVPSRLIGALKALGTGSSYGSAEPVNAVNDLARTRFWRGSVFGVPEDVQERNQARAMEAVSMAAPIVYHGTPHRFPPTAKNPLGEFNSTKIGSGEGAQAYGYGHYVAESPGVAKSYQTALTHSDDYVDGQLLDSSIPKHFLAKILNEESGNVGNARDALQSLARPGGSKSVADSAKQALMLLDSGQRPKLQTIKPEGSLYKVDLPDEVVPRMLDWDKPLSQQHPDVQAALAKIDKDTYHPQGMDYAPEEQGQMIYMRLANSPSAKTQSQAAELLKGAGIPGIQYLDAGSRGASTGTRNFVVFPGNEGLLNILGRE